MLGGGLGLCYGMPWGAIFAVVGGAIGLALGLVLAMVDLLSMAAIASAVDPRERRALFLVLATTTNVITAFVPGILAWRAVGFGEHDTAFGTALVIIPTVLAAAASAVATVLLTRRHLAP